MNLARLARWCYRRRRLVLVLWIAGFAVMNILSGTIGNRYDNTFSGGSSDSATALSLLQTRFPQTAGDTATIVFEAKNGVNDPAVRARMDGLFAQVMSGKVPHVVSVASPYQMPGQISRDGNVAYATVTFSGLASTLPSKTAQPLVDAAKQTELPGLKIGLGGPVVEQAVQKQGGSTEFIGILAAMVILFIAFGSLMAMSLPVIAAIFGVGIGSTFVVLLSHVMSVPGFAPYLAVMIGLGVGIDYALFIVTRYRAGLHDGLSPEDADVLALTTSGRAVLFAGSTVIISLLGMFMIGINLIYGFAVGAVLAVLMVMLASVTLVPAIIGFAGQKLAANEHKRSNPRETPAYRWSRQIQRRPWLWGAVSLILLIALAIPLFSIRLGASDQGNDPPSYTTRQAYDLLAEGFGPGFNGPLLLAADLGGTTTSGRVHTFVQSVRSDSDVAYVSSIRSNPSGTAAVVTVIPKSAPQDRATEDLVHRIRNDVAQTGLALHVGGETAVAVDGSDQMGQRLPYMVVAVILLSFLLLMTLFRSVVVALKAVIVEPALDRSGLRRRRGNLPMGLVARPGGDHSRSDRILGADVDVHRPLRPVDGLRGVPPQPNQGGISTERGQLLGCCQRARHHRTSHHGRRCHHGLCLLVIRPSGHPGCQAHGDRSRRRHLHRRLGRKDDSRAFDDAGPGQGQLVDAQMAAACRPSDRYRAGGRTLAGSHATSVSSGRSVDGNIGRRSHESMSAWPFVQKIWGHDGRTEASFNLGRSDALGHRGHIATRQEAAHAART